MSKAWKTIDWPTAVERKHPSQVAAYRHVTAARDAWLSDKSRVNKVVVWVSENKGPWECYERLNLND